MTRDDPTAFAPPPAFGPFRVLHQIGVGALGPVFRTYEPTRDRLVAVKVFRLDVTPEQSQALADELSRAADAGLFHPSIVEPIAAGVEGTVAYRAEEYVAGESMDVAIRHYAPAALDKALPFLTQLAGAIDFARAAGVGHGALHLRDIFVTPDEARASGFGVVDALERVGIRAPVRRPYTAPERIAGEPWSTPADVFSLAAIAYELLTGRRPAGTGDQIGLLTGDTVGEHAAAIRAVLARAMDDDPSRRYPTALGFASALEAAARGEHVTDALRDLSAISAVVPAPLVQRPVTAVPVMDELGDAPEEDEAVPAEIDDLPDEPVVDGEVVEAEEGVDALDAAIDDVSAEREADEAHYDLLREEAEAEPPQPASLFDEEAAADLAMEEPATARFADEFGQTDGRGPDLLGPAKDDGRRADLAGPPENDDRRPDLLAPPDTVERPRPAMLPLAMTLILGLLIGFAAGYAVSGRDHSATPSSAETAGSPTPTPQRVTAPAPPGKEFSEQTVTQPSPSGGRTASAGQPPPVPGDEPATRPPSPPPSESASARPTTGTIVVRSTPSRAPVTVNGRWRGRTPLTLDALKFGPYTVRVVQPGYAIAREEITLSASDPTRTLSFRLQPSTPAAAPGGRTRAPPPRPAPPERQASYPGSIYVDSRPRGATILIDGKAVGTTPARIPDVGIGSHVVRLELADHRPWSASTRVAAGQETRVTGSLERIR